MHTLYTLGYARWTLDQVEATVREHSALLFDIRLNPFSRKPGFSKQALANRLGDARAEKEGRYRHVPKLGNVNYKGGPISLKDTATGLALLRAHLARQPTILLCGCANVETCHRRTVADLAAARFGIEVVHLEPPAEAQGGFVKAISLWQPWASLCVICDPAYLKASDGLARIAAKNFETRSWATSYRGPLLIHAAKRFNREQQSTCLTEPFRSVLRDWGGFTTLAELPFGALVGQVVLDAVHDTHQLRVIIPAQERAFGNWSDGRKAWKLENPIRFDAPIPYRGQQGLFDVPASILPDLLPSRHA